MKKSQIILLCCGGAALVLGLILGGYADTFGKAIRICLECVGIG